MRRIVTLAAIIGIVAVSVLGGVLPAQAASVPPVVMAGCNGSAGIDPPERGGWIGGRDVTATGTPSTDTSPVRARTARLGEPCWDEGTLSMPIQVTDIPADKLDDDDDGEDDGNPNPVGGECAGSSSLATQQPTGTQVQAVTTSCETAQVAYNTSGTPPIWSAAETVTVTGTPLDADTITVAYSGLNDADNRGRILYTWLYCKSNLGAVSSTADDSFAPNDWSTTIPTNDTLNCNTAGDALWRVVVMQRVGNVYAGGVVWAADAIDPPETGGTGYWGGTQEAPIMFAPLVGVDYYGESTDQRSVVYCSTSYEGEPTLDFTMMPIIIKSGFGYYPPPGNDPVTADWSVNLVLFPAVESPTFVTADCPYIHSISLMMCTWSGNGPTTGACAQYLWDAEAWRTHSGYTGSDGQPPGTLLCEVFPTTPGCYDVLNPPFVDGTDFDQVCADGPEFVAPGWANFSDWIPDLLEWFGASVGHYAECLFIPVNGWDRDGLVESSWQASPIGQMNDIVTGAFTEISAMTGTCGSILDVEIMGTPMEIDTCTWTWAVPLREMLTWTFLVLGGFGVASFLISTTLSLIKSPAPNPLDEGKK